MRFPKGISVALFRRDLAAGLFAAGLVALVLAPSATADRAGLRGSVPAYAVPAAQTAGVPALIVANDLDDEGVVAVASSLNALVESVLSSAAGESEGRP